MVYVPLPPGADRAAAEESWRKLAKDMFEKGPLYWADKMAAAKKSCPELGQFLVAEIEKLQQEKYGKPEAPKNVAAGSSTNGGTDGEVRSRSKRRNTAGSAG